MIKRYCFTRPAKNAAWSSRTAKIGSIKGTLAQAIRKALTFITQHGEVTIVDYDDNVIVAIVSPTLRVNYPKTDYYTQVSVLPSLVQEVIKS